MSVWGRFVANFNHFLSDQLSGNIHNFWMDWATELGLVLFERCFSVNSTLFWILGMGPHGNTQKKTAPKRYKTALECWNLMCISALRNPPGRSIFVKNSVNLFLSLDLWYRQVAQRQDIVTITLCVSRTAPPKGTKSCRRQGEFLFVHWSVSPRDALGQAKGGLRGPTLDLGGLSTAQEDLELELWIP